MCKRFPKMFQKTRAAKSPSPPKRFSISKRNSITKMTTYMAKVIMRPKTKSQGFEEVITTTPIGDGLVECFPLRCNTDSFLWCQCKNEWRSLPSLVKRHLTTSGGNCIRGQRGFGVLRGVLHPLQNKKKNAKMVAKACHRYHQSGWLASSTPDLNSGQCWRNVPAFGSTEILTHWRSRLRRWWEKFPWSWFANRSMTEPVICRALCKQKASLWVTIEMSFLKYFLFLENFVPYLLYMHLNKYL